MKCYEITSYMYMLSYKLNKIVFVYSKKWVHPKIGQYLRPPAGCLHGNSRKSHPILKIFSPQPYLIEISVEFEDEPFPIEFSWVFVWNIIIFYGNPCKHGSTRILVNS